MDHYDAAATCPASLENRWTLVIFSCIGTDSENLTEPSYDSFIPNLIFDLYLKFQISDMNKNGRFSLWMCWKMCSSNVQDGGFFFPHSVRVFIFVDMHFATEQISSCHCINSSPLNDG